MNTITLKAYAKINLHLDVTGRLPNGYHTIRSIMQQVSLHDDITVERLDCPPDTAEIAITCTEPTIPTDGRNIVHRCATAFFKQFNITSYRIAIHIHKRIPHGAGMAGGSTDGAAVLKALPLLFGIDAEEKGLCEIGGGVGADIPFCVVGGCCPCEGIGEVITPVERRFDCPVLVAIAGEPVSTPEAYGRIDAMWGNRLEEHGAPSSPRSLLASEAIPEALYNIFESVVLSRHAEAAALKEALCRLGARAALMSGSGPSVFGLFDSTEARDGACRALSDSRIRAFPCEFV